MTIKGDKIHRLHSPIIIWGAPRMTLPRTSSIWIGLLDPAKVRSDRALTWIGTWRIRVVSLGGNFRRNRKNSKLKLGCLRISLSSKRFQLCNYQTRTQKKRGAITWSQFAPTTASCSSANSTSATPSYYHVKMPRPKPKKRIHTIRLCSELLRTATCLRNSIEKK